MEIRPSLPPPPLATAPLPELVAPDTQDPYLKAVDDIYLYNKYRPQEGRSLASLRRELSAAEVACLDDLPALTADGLTRNAIHFMGAQTFRGQCEARGWEKVGETPLVDVVVIGAGPGGLATSYHLAQQGARVVTLEGGYAAQAFSDAGAASVHSMRTDRLLTSLVRTGRALEDLSTVMGLPAGLGQIVAHASAARHQLAERTGHRIDGLPEGVETLDRYQPAARAELFEHFQEVASYLAGGCPNSFLLERSPVVSRQREGDYFRLKTRAGHELLARQVVLATGLVTPGGANSRPLPVFERLAEAHPERYLTLSKDEDLATHAGLLGSRDLILADRLLGRPDVKRALHELPAQSRVAVVGSGESALKGALEVLSQNPTLKVDLFVKAALEPSQVQVPTENFHPVVLEGAPDRPTYGQRSLERFTRFDTPVTPRSMLEALEEVSAGRLRIHEMGAYFDETSVEVEPGRIRFRSPEVRAALARQNAAWKAAGLRPEPVPEAIENVRMVICAAGYDRGALAPVTDESGVSYNSSAVLRTAADSAIPGMAVRGRKLAEELAQRLPVRERPPQAERPENPGADWAHGYSEEDFQGFVTYRGLAPAWVESQGGPQETPQFDFPDPDRFLRELAEREPASLTPAEKVTLERAYGLVRRMGRP